MSLRRQHQHQHQRVQLSARRRMTMSSPSVSIGSAWSSQSSRPSCSASGRLCPTARQQMAIGDNNLVQSSMMQQVMTANDIAASALRAASAQSTNLASMQSRLGAMGQLAMVDFCLTQTVCPFPPFLGSTRRCKFGGIRTDWIRL